MNNQFLNPSLLKDSHFGIVAGPNGSGKTLLLLQSAKHFSPASPAYYDPHASRGETGYCVFENNLFYALRCANFSLFVDLVREFCKAFPQYGLLSFGDSFSHFEGCLLVTDVYLNITPYHLLPYSVRSYLKIISLFLLPESLQFFDNVDAFLSPTVSPHLLNSLALISQAKGKTGVFMAINSPQFLPNYIDYRNVFTPFLSTNGQAITIHSLAEIKDVKELEATLSHSPMAVYQFSSWIHSLVVNGKDLSTVYQDK